MSILKLEEETMQKKAHNLCHWLQIYAPKYQSETDMAPTAFWGGEYQSLATRFDSLLGPRQPPFINFQLSVL